MTEAFIILVLIAANGLFAMAEAAFIVGRKRRIQELAESGVASAQTALKLSQDPQQLLSTVQLGITLIGVLAGAYSGATVAARFERLLEVVGLAPQFAREAAIGLVVLLVTFLTIVLGELVPKRVALAHSERVALIIARPLYGLSRLLAPFVWILNKTSSWFLTVLRLDTSASAPISQEEIRISIEEGRDAGVLDKEEHEIAQRALRLGDISVASIMTPRTDIIWLRSDLTFEEVLKLAREDRHTVYPVSDSSIDEIQGILHIKDLWDQLGSGESIQWTKLVSTPFFVPATNSVVDLLEAFRAQNVRQAIVLDEHGGTEGLVTLGDVLEALVGSVPTDLRDEEQSVVQRDDSSWLVDGGLPLNDFLELFPDVARDEIEVGGVHTVAGFLMARLGRIPTVAESVAVEDLKIEVVDMDGNRIDKLLITRMEHDLPTAADER